MDPAMYRILSENFDPPWFDYNSMVRNEVGYAVELRRLEETGALNELRDY